MIRPSEETLKKQGRWFRSIRLIALFLVGIAVASIAISYHVSRRFLMRAPLTSKQTIAIQERRAWLQSEHNAIPVIFPSKEGHLAGLLFCRPHAQRVILGCHGYHRCKEDLWQLAEVFPKDTILLFDFRAHGQSSGTYSSIGLKEAEDVIHAKEFLATQRLTKDLPVIGIGLSMGAVALLGAAAQGASFHAIVADSAYENLDAQIGRVFTKQSGLPNFPFLNVCKYFFKRWHGTSLQNCCALTWTQQCRAPLFFIHSEHDNFTPCSCSQNLCQFAAEPKKLWVTQTQGHAEHLKTNPRFYAETIEQFLQNITK